MARSNRDNLIRTFLTKNRRATSIPVDQFPRNPNPGAKAAFRPAKQGTPSSRPRKRSTY